MLGRIISDVELAVARLGSQAFWTGLMALALLAGLSFLTAGVWSVIAARHGAAEASLLVGAGFVVIAGVLFLITRRIARQRRLAAMRARARNGADAATLAETFLVAMETGRAMRR
ncbi:hypothetical protein FDP22_08030 [Paroceanicella profunda]|uniref:Phage holin family protein n=1 Tax=Paroceanicella profunda TaxID=2579971 RepID=A0A5B8FZN0_9RHOB|nr:hypothetical protein [Paroceanicella profunda]QDL91733.1 hypothetical protein FDP22_08030 [Paroceanicella profunda]